MKCRNGGGGHPALESSGIDGGLTLRSARVDVGIQGRLEGTRINPVVWSRLSDPLERFVYVADLLLSKFDEIGCEISFNLCAAA